MEHVIGALDKAGVSLDRERMENLDTPVARRLPSSTIPGPLPEEWNPVEAQLNARLLERNRIVAFAMADPAHVAFNHLRTRIRGVLNDNHWSAVGVTSPTPGCGKTMVALNLAFSFARAGDVRTVLVDLDFKRPSVARTLGLRRKPTLVSYLRGQLEDPRDCFVQLAPGLVAGLNTDTAVDSSELIQSARMGELLGFIHATLRPDILLFDLPPMKSSDDALAFLPKIDGALLVAAAGQSKTAEVDECERQLDEYGKMLGVVLNKSDTSAKDYHYY